jgi:hypothetical protein
MHPNQMPGREQSHEPEISAELSRQSMLVERLGNLIQELDKRLASVLRSDPPVGSNGATPRSIRNTSIGTALQAYNDKLAGVADALESIIARAEC